MEITQLRGLLFEEAVLFLLEHAGYRTISDWVGDPTLARHPAGIGVVGRGALHQIDAIADYMIGQPFSHPQRLLVEAKCFTNHKPVELDVLRSAVGVLKDVSEFWSTQRRIPDDPRRYHYQKAIFSATTFTGPAEKYAFAHDISLFPMAESACFRPVLNALFKISREIAPQLTQRYSMMDLRRLMRRQLRSIDDDGDFLPQQWRDFVGAVQSIGGVLVGIIAYGFPLFLVPADRGVLSRLGDLGRVTIKQNDSTGWTINSLDGRVLFSFDLPPLLFSRYADAGELTRTQAAALKAEAFTGLHSIVRREDRLQLIQFRLDHDWLQRVRNRAQDAAGKKEE